MKMTNLSVRIAEVSRDFRRLLMPRARNTPHELQSLNSADGEKVQMKARKSCCSTCSEICANNFLGQRLVKNNNNRVAKELFLR